jgi:hypothetical protein
VSEGVADRDLVLDTEREAVAVKIKPRVGDRDADRTREGDADAEAVRDPLVLGLPHAKPPSENVWSATIPASVKLANGVPLASRTSSTCPAMNDGAVSLRLLMVTEERAMAAPRSIWRNSLVVAPSEIKRLTPVGAIRPSTAYKHRVLKEEDVDDVHALPCATLASPDADTATISFT